MIFAGNPGTGKTMTARCMAGILLRFNYSYVHDFMSETGANLLNRGISEIFWDFLQTPRLFFEDSP